jgi:hypothetical protein
VALRSSPDQGLSGLTAQAERRQIAGLGVNFRAECAVTAFVVIGRIGSSSQGNAILELIRPCARFSKMLRLSNRSFQDSPRPTSTSTSDPASPGTNLGNSVD